MEAPIEQILRNVDQLTDRRTGFLPTKTPLIELQSPFEFVAAACNELPGRYHGTTKDCRPWLHDLFKAVDPAWEQALPFLEPHTAEALMTKLSLLAHAYRWQSMPTNPNNYQITSIDLPVGLEHIWTKLARALGIPRVGIFYTMVTNNWRIKGKDGGQDYTPDELSSESIELIHPWLAHPESEELRTFVITALGIEAKGRSALNGIVRAYRAILRNNPQELTFALMLVEGVLLNVLSIFNTQIKKTRINPGNFLRCIQPTMVWLLDHGDGPLEGASGPQACTMQCIDTFLGVPRESELGAVIIESRKYMLPKHRELLNSFDGASQVLRTYVRNSNEPRLVEVYNRCLETLLSWRRSHQKRGGMYIQGESKKHRDPYVSTGLIVKIGGDQVQRYDSMMEAHIGETRAQLAEDIWKQNNLSFDYLFRYLDEEKRLSLKDKLKSLRYEPGEYIINCADRFPGLFLIKSGTVEVLRETNGVAKCLASLTTGEIVGEMSLIENCPATADVRALTPVEVEHLSVEALYEVVAESPKIEAGLYLALAQVLSRRLRESSASTSPPSAA